VRAALAFLTPLGGARTPSPTTLRWFPVVGLLVGLAVGLSWWAADEVWAPAVAAALVVVVDLALTGMLHVDGLADSADGLLPHLGPPAQARPRRLEIMAEPTIGAFGVTVVVATLLLRWAALASMAVDVWLVCGLWVLSRSLMAAVLTSVPYARDGGLAGAFLGAPGGRVTAAGGGLLAVVLVTAGVGLPAVAVVTAALVAGGGVVALGVRRLGGFTGDVLGAAGVVAETVGLAVAAARW
jgi:adenosylcobinamide-GDP ribazoletransferase